MEEKITNSIQNKTELVSEDISNKEESHRAPKFHPKIIVPLMVIIAFLIIVMIIKNHTNRKDWTSGVEIGNPVYMQSWDGCDDLSVGELVKLADKRDEELYVIRKQADGKCWMLENLSLDLTNQQVQSKMNSHTTNASDASLAYLLNGGGTSEDQFAKEGIADWSSSNKYDSYSRPLAYVELKDTTIDTATYFASGYNERVGIYYNYCAASAGSFCYEVDILRKKADYAETEITEDICPAGWSLPTKNEFVKLLGLKSPYHRNTKLGDDTIAFLDAFHTSERIGSSSYTYIDYYSKDEKELYIDDWTTEYWSGTQLSAQFETLAYTLDIGLYNSPTIRKADTSHGFTVRCLHK